MNKCREWMNTLTEERSMSKKEYVLALSVCALAGVVIGILLSPKKHTVIGSNNSNYEKTPEHSCSEEDCCCEKDDCC